MRKRTPPPRSRRVRGPRPDAAKARAAGRAALTAYIARAPKLARPMLRELRRLVRATVPEADEKLSYRVPYHHYRGRLIYYGAFKDHVSVWVMGEARQVFAKQLKPYRTGEATFQFPYGRKLPLALLRRCLLHRRMENDASGR